MVGKLDNKVALITGAAGGIGAGVALKFAEEGCHIAVCDFNMKAAEEMVEKLKAKGVKAIAVQMDVSDEEAVNSGVKKIQEELGFIEVVVNNAGIQHICAVHELKFKDWKKMMNVHLDGAFLITKAVLPQMYEKNSGRIIYMGSVHSHVASLLKAPYVTAKHGLLGLCRVVAKEGAPHGVTANVVCPGFVKTPLVEKQIPEQAERLGISEEDVVKKVMLKDTVDGEFTTIDDVAEACVHFAAFPTKALTGQSMIVSHGWTMQ
eukprot:GCRY01003629.1.p1 GENE.GCRY01003629.1~~GCRY01003629.1.p1  ORF type:complete len:282 (+),score=74.60 GCRY01003629.1:63-848(+)